MKTLYNRIYLIILVNIAFELSSQSFDQNFIHTRSYIGTGNEYIETIQYFDGWASCSDSSKRNYPYRKRLDNTLTEYDGVGREQYNWLPKTNSGNGAFMDAVSFKSKSEPFYNR
ncbi:MAG: hypothetical protein QM751_08850 [Paludibacteraceae bacterium]